MAMRMAEGAGVPVLNLAVDSPRDICVFLRNRALTLGQGVAPAGRTR